MKRKRALFGTTKKVGFLGLVAFAISAAIGGGIFSLPQSVAERSSVGITLVAWVITGLGIFFIVRCFSIISVKKPKLKNGIYTYANEGFGKLVGFLAAFGYWAAGAGAMASYGLLVTKTLSSLVPAFGAGNTWPAFFAASVIVWTIFLLGTRGIKKVAILNVVGTIAKFIPIAIFIIAMIVVFQPALFVADFWGELRHGASVMNANDTPMGELMDVILVTLWVFIGIETAVVVSRDAVNQKSVARAMMVGYFITLILYILVSLLPYGVMDQVELAHLQTPSTGYLLQMVMGPFGLILISVGIILSILFGWIVWAQVQAEMPATLAENGSFPPLFAQRNSHGAPVASLFITSLFVEFFMLCGIVFGDAAFQEMVSLTSTLAGPVYFLVTFYLLKLVFFEKDLWAEKSREKADDKASEVLSEGSGAAGEPAKAWPAARIGALIAAILGTAFSTFVVISAGLVHIFFGLCVLCVSLIFFFWGTKSSKVHTKLKKYELAIVIGAPALASIGFITFALGLWP